MVRQRLRAAGWRSHQQLPRALVRIYSRRTRRPTAPQRCRLGPPLRNPGTLLCGPASGRGLGRLPRRCDNPAPLAGKVRRRTPWITVPSVRTARRSTSPARFRAYLPDWCRGERFLRTSTDPARSSSPPRSTGQRCGRCRPCLTSPQFDCTSYATVWSRCPLSSTSTPSCRSHSGP